jgi:hypothetical protein
VLGYNQEENITMAVRVIKNYTDEDLHLPDLSATIPANGAADIGGDEARLIELAISDRLLEALAQGIEKFQVNDGIRDLNLSAGIDLIRKIQAPTERDELGRWVVRVDSRRRDFDQCFAGAGDDMLNGGTISQGPAFCWDFEPGSDYAGTEIAAPTGYKRQRIEWQFTDGIYLKEGTIYQFNAPKGSYMDMYVVCPPGGYYQKKFWDPTTMTITRTTHQATEMTVVNRWVAHYRIEGSAPMGDELNTESAADVFAHSYFVWRVDITVPEVAGYEDFHGHFTLEMYRPRTVLWT